MSDCNKKFAIVCFRNRRGNSPIFYKVIPNLTWGEAYGILHNHCDSRVLESNGDAVIVEEGTLSS